MNKAKEVIKQVKRTGFSIDQEFTKIGFALDSVGANQIAYCLITESNKWLKDNFGLNISIFYEENAFPCVKPNMGRFHISDISIFDGHLISTSFNTMSACQNAFRAKKYYYINNPDWQYIDVRFSKEKFDNIMRDDSIIKFTRCEDYKRALEQLGYTIHPKIVQDFNINQIMEIVNV